jgi:hypothetical protein
MSIKYWVIVPAVLPIQSKNARFQIMLSTASESIMVTNILGTPRMVHSSICRARTTRLIEKGLKPVCTHDTVPHIAFKRRQSHSLRLNTRFRVEMHPSTHGCPGLFFSLI